ncbi:MAG TPA: ArsR family transcriptional regulator [Tepidisphaeraceae bacterium]
MKVTAQPFDTTGGRILELLCHGRRTVSDLAKGLQLTDNAVRAHLASMERDGIISGVGLRRGLRRPNVLYDLTPQGRRLFPTAYEPVLKQVVDVLSERLQPERSQELLLEVGRRLAETHLSGIRSLDKSARLPKLMGLLGVAAHIRREGGKLFLRGCGCPLASVVSAQPRLCDVVAVLLGDILEIPVQRACEQGASPACCFEIGDDATGLRPSSPQARGTGISPRRNARPRRPDK